MAIRAHTGIDVRRGVGGLLMALVLVSAALPTTTALAVEPAEESWAYDLAREVMSPFCPGRTLSSCPSPQAAELIQWVILQESAGATRAEVEDQLYERYGDVIRGAPKAEGWGLAAYVIPPIAAILGIGLVIFVLRRLSSGGEIAADSEAEPTHTAAPRAAPTAADEEIERLVDQELEQI